MRSRNPKIMAIYDGRAAARGLTVEQWFEVIEREHQESLERAPLRTDRSRQRAAIARHAVRCGRTWTVAS